MTQTQDSPTPIGEVSFDDHTAVLFSDGAVVTLGVGGGSCSAHGTLMGECDHDSDADNDVPTFDGEAFLDAAGSDSAIQTEALSRLAQDDPERVAGAVGR